MDTLATLSDRGMRRLLGSRTFLRGLDYFRRKVVGNSYVDGSKGFGIVQPLNGEPYPVTLEMGEGGIQSHCQCPSFQKTKQHCKHAAALLITLRDQARSSSPKQVLPPPDNQELMIADANFKHGKRPLPKNRNHSSMTSRSTNESIFSKNVKFPKLPVENQQTKGIQAWVPQEGMPGPRRVEFRLYVRQNALTITVFDADIRAATLPSIALAWQAYYPSPDRNALRLLSRFESGNPKHPSVDIRGEDVSDLIPLLEGQKVLLEPSLMQLRFSDDILKPKFELELAGVDTITARVVFEKPSDRRRFSLLQGGWFEGYPGWHIDIQEGIVRRIDKRVSPVSLRRLLRVPAIAEPMNQLPILIMQGLPKVALDIGADLPELSQIADVVDLQPIFRLKAGGSLLEAHVHLVAAYGDQEIAVRADGISPPILIKPAVEGSKRVTCLRVDIASQQEAAQKLASLHLSQDESGEGFIAKGDEAIRFWTDGLPELPDDWDLFVPEDLIDTHVRPKSVSAFAKVTSGVDWLSINLTFQSDGIAVDRNELRRCLMEGKKYVKLSDGSFAPIDPASIQAVLDREFELLSSASKQGKLSFAQAGKVTDLMKLASSSMISPGAKSLFEKLQNIEKIDPIKKPRTLKATLRPYQDDGFSWLKFIHDIGSGGILADDMGLGKTVQTIALLLAVKQEEKKISALIVAPTSVVTNWQRELSRFAPTLSVALWHGPDRKDQVKEAKSSEILITSYALLRRDIDFFCEKEFTYAILDEAQHIKNPLSATAAAAKKIISKKRLALTGTPIENRLSEIWSIFSFVSPGLLGSLETFESKYGRPIESGDYKIAQKLQSFIHPFILRRMKQEVAKDLPEKIETDQFCDLPEEQSAIYFQVAKEVRAQVMNEVEKVGIAKSQIQILAALTKLRQAACDPRLLGLPKEFTDDDSGKLLTLRELMGNAVESGHKVLVFSQFVSMLKIIERVFKEDKINYVYLDGSTKDREERVDRFQNDPTVSAFLISLKAGGTGLNLTAADTVIHFDPWWNPAVEAQATDRAHRIGQNKVVTVYRLIAAGTIEEKILLLKDKKQKLVSSVLSEDSGGAKKLTKADLEDLFSL